MVHKPVAQGDEKHRSGYTVLPVIDPLYDRKEGMDYYGIIQMMLPIKTYCLRIMIPEKVESVHKIVMDSEEAKDPVPVFLCLDKTGMEFGR